MATLEQRVTTLERVTRRIDEDVQTIVVSVARLEEGQKQIRGELRTLRKDVDRLKTDVAGLKTDMVDVKAMLTILVQRDGSAN